MSQPNVREFDRGRVVEADVTFARNCLTAARARKKGFCEKNGVQGCISKGINAWYTFLRNTG
jgi:hypothetical protein